MTTLEQTTSKSSRKRMGVHYTPPLLARLVADKIVGWIDSAHSGPVRWLDPACGGGQLLMAGIDAMSKMGLVDWEVVGVEADPDALERTRERLHVGDHGSVRLVAGDFLDIATAFQPQGQLWAAQPGDSPLGERFKLYSGRRRYITQYVGKYPLPRADTSTSRRIATLARALVEEMRRGASSDSCAGMEKALDALVNEAYVVEADGVPK